MPATITEPNVDFHAAAGAFADVAERVLAGGGAACINSDDLERCITAAIKLYAAKAEAENALPPPSHASG